MQVTFSLSKIRNMQKNQNGALPSNPQSNYFQTKIYNLDARHEIELKSGFENNFIFRDGNFLCSSVRFLGGHVLRPIFAKIQLFFRLNA